MEPYTTKVLAGHAYVLAACLACSMIGAIARATSPRRAVRALGLLCGFAAVAVWCFQLYSRL